MTLTLHQLRAELDRLSLSAHRMADTNVLSVSASGADVALAFDESELRDEIADAEKERARYERLYHAECDKSLALKQRAELAERQMDRVRAEIASLSKP